MGSSYLGHDERGEYCELCYGRPSDVSREEYDKLALTIKAASETSDGEQSRRHPMSDKVRELANEHGPDSRLREIGIRAAVALDAAHLASIGVERFVRAALALRGHVTDPEHCCAPDWSKVIEFDRAFLAMGIDDVELTEEDAARLYEEAKAGARPFTPEQVERFIRNTILGHVDPTHLPARE